MDDQGNIIEIDNGLGLESVLNQFLSPCGLTLKSDFFGINPDNTHPANKAYDYAKIFYQDIVVYQASDVIRAESNENATILSLSFEQLMKNMALFNLEFIRTTNESVLRLEHVSYRRQNRNFDLVDGNFTWIKGKARGQYDSADKPRFERFSFKYETGSKDFDGAYIEYDALCSSDDESNQKDYPLPNLLTNLAFLYENETLQEDLSTQEDAIVFVALDAGAIAQDVGAISGITIANGPLCWANVLANLWLWDRPQASGFVNGHYTIFESSVRDFKQDKLTYKVCMDDFFDEYNEDDQVRSQLGWSDIDGSKYKLPSEQLELNLKN